MPLGYGGEGALEPGIFCSEVMLLFFKYICKLLLIVLNETVYWVDMYLVRRFVV